MISVLVPYRPDGGHRERTWTWLEQRWAALVPEAELVVEGDDGGEHPGQFNHPLAINRAAARASGDVFVIADCDTAFDPAWIRTAATNVLTGAPWVLPLHYDKLSEADSSELLTRDPAAALPSYAPEWRGTGINWSGLVVVTRQGFEAVGGYDERIAWWGADDICFGLTMDALHGRHERLEGAATHVWHPQPTEHSYGHGRHPEQQAIVDRYIASAEDPEAIREVRFRERVC